MVRPRVLWRNFDLDDVDSSSEDDEAEDGEEECRVPVGRPRMPQPDWVGGLDFSRAGPAVVAGTNRDGAELLVSESGSEDGAGGGSMSNSETSDRGRDSRSMSRNPETRDDTEDRLSPVSAHVC
jgi:hypothetical protein